ncbi:MAG: alpha/beta hydrolase [Phenylobacterium sp.]|uniref:alpha/beta hydrolase n=1 Tax=Phenylobacterium sp. TaxID=1871053 RepID=UPI00120E8AAF|nr:alpha/beta hydrolase [Phenylobacterium sp.]TAJ70174.1 MAG: alpha/beta hydrolase [Phenylobacterium sp.]
MRAGRLRAVGAGVVAAILLGVAASAQAADPASFPVYAQPLPESGGNPERIDEIPGSGGQRIVRNVTQPSLIPFLPDPAKANGTAVIVAPGGGFMMLSLDSEGILVAKKLAEQGATAFVLKYRVEQTPPAPAVFMVEMMKRMRGLQNPKGPDGKPLEHRLPPFATEPLAAEDAAAAVKLVRARASDWGVDPKRVGFVGFSAGAITAANISTGEAAGRPDFVGIVYGALGTPVPADAPPAFIVTAADDPLLPARASIPIFNAWKAAGRPAELHIYERGGHGFGMTPKGASSDHWFEEFVWWMEARGLLKSAARKAAP